MLILVQAFSLNSAIAQCWQRASGLGGADMETPTSMAVSSSGHLALTGEFMGTAVFDTHTLVATAGRDVFTLLLDTSGVVVNAMGGVGDGLENMGTGVATDNSGNVLVTGNFTGTITFDDVSLVSGGAGDIFLVKYDASGNLLWAKQAGGESDIKAYDIAVDEEGNAIILGEFYNTANFDDKSVLSTSALDVFTAKYDSDGNAIWAVRCGSTSADVGTGISVDHAGNVYISGYFQAGFSFGEQTFISIGNRDVFLAKMDAQGNPVWATVGGGMNNDFFNKLAVDAGGNNIYVCGEFESFTADMDGIILTNSNQSAPRKDIMLLSFDGSGSARWAINAGSTEHDYAKDISLDENGTIYITGIYENEIAFGNNTLTGDDLFIASFDSTGQSIWATGSSYNTALAGSHSIATFENSPVIAGDLVAGSAFPIVAFDHDTILSKGSLDVFFARIGPPCNSEVTGFHSRTFGDAGLDIYPNPFSDAFQIRSPERISKAEVCLYNIQGQQVLHKAYFNLDHYEVPTDGLPPGIYFLQVNSTNTHYVFKMIKTRK